MVLEDLEKNLKNLTCGSEDAILFNVVNTKFLRNEDVRMSFRRLMSKKNYPQVIGVEIGVYEGLNSLFMLKLMPNLKLYLVDNWKNIEVYTGGPKQDPILGEIVASNCKLNLQGFNGRAVFTNKNSEEAYKDFEDGYFDYVYVDGDHSHNAVKRDLELWFPKLKVGGIMGGHDIGMKEVCSAVNEFAAENNIPQDKINFILEPPQSDWWIDKEI